MSDILVMPENLWLLIKRRGQHGLRSKRQERWSKRIKDGDAHLQLDPLNYPSLSLQLTSSLSSSWTQWGMLAAWA